MQETFQRHYPSLDLAIIGIGEFGTGSNNAGLVEGRDLPWLQDTDRNNNGVSDVWYDSWKITYRDVVLVDQSNNELARYNLTNNSLATEANFHTLKHMFVEEAATDPATEWQSPIEKLDVDHSEFVAARDALLIINQLATKTYGDAGVLPALNGAQPQAYYDTTGDMRIAAQDAILVINHLIRMNSSGTSSPVVMSPLAGSQTTMDQLAIDQLAVDQTAPELVAETVETAVLAEADALSGLVEPGNRQLSTDAALQAWQYEAGDPISRSERMINIAEHDLALANLG